MTAAVELPPSSLPGLRTIELRDGEAPLLQRFFEANPDYFIAVHGEPAGPAEAHDEIHAPLPAGWPYTHKWLIGYVDRAGSLAAVVDVVIDLLAAGVWHIGLFMVAPARHGTGDAQALHAGLEAWARSHGARWLRLGVVQGNARAERFWRSLGYVQVRTREGLAMGRRVNTVRVLVKPLGGDSLDTFLSLVPRDRPDAPNLP